MITTKPRLTLQQLAQIKPKAPEDAGEKWVGISHFELLTALRVAAQVVGLETYPKGLHPSFALSRDRADFAASLSFVLRDREGEEAGVQGEVFSLGVMHSNARRHSLTLFGGVDDGTGCPLVFADFALGRRREGSFLLTERMNEAMASVFATLRMVPEIRRGLIAKKYSKQQYERTLVGLARANIVPWSRLNQLDKLCKVSHEINARDLLCHISQVLRLSPPLFQMKLRRRAYEFLLEN